MEKPELTLTREDYILAARHAIATGDDATLEHDVPIILAAAQQAGVSVAAFAWRGPFRPEAVNALRWVTDGPRWARPEWSPHTAEEWQAFAPDIDVIFVGGEQVTP